MQYTFVFTILQYFIGSKAYDRVKLMFAVKLIKWQGLYLHLSFSPARVGSNMIGFYDGVEVCS